MGGYNIKYVRSACQSQDTDKNLPIPQQNQPQHFGTEKDFDINSNFSTKVFGSHLSQRTRELNL